MKNKIWIATLTAFLGLAAVTQGTLIIAASSDGQARDTDNNGAGNSITTGSPLVGISTHFREGNIQALWAFPLATAVGPGSVTAAQFSVNVTQLPPAASTFNVDLYAIRIAPSDTFLAMDYESFDSLILEDFWTPVDGTGELTADMTSYLQGTSWSSSDFLIMGVKTAPLTLTPGVDQKWLGFETGDGTVAELIVTVIPEPSTLALLGLGGAVLGVTRRRKTRG